MRQWALAGWLACATVLWAQQVPRTPSGELWAGTTLQLRAAVVNSSGGAVALSNPAEVRVGQVVRWRVEYESLPYGTTDRDAWFTLLVQNRGNGYDTLLPKLHTLEAPDATPWQITLYEQLTPDQSFEGATLVSEALAPVAPGEQRRLFLRARAPSDRNTDGAFLFLNARPLMDASLRFERNFVAGVEATRGVATQATAWSNYTLVAEPALIEGRLWWVANNGTDTRVFFTPQPLTTTGTFTNNTQGGAKLIGITLGGAGVFTNDWLFLTASNGMVGAFPLNFLSQNGSLAPTWLNLPLPVRTNVAPVWDGVLVFFADITEQVIVFDPVRGLATFLLRPTDSPIVALYTLPERIVVVARANGLFEVIQNGVRVRSNVRLPNAGTTPLLGAAYDARRGNLIVSAGTRVGCYNFRANQWLWVLNTGTALIGAPVYDFATDACYVLDSTGQLWALDSGGGAVRPLYPQRCFNRPLSKATLTALARQDRKVSYVYVLAQFSDGTVETRMITAVNPFNRFVNTTIPAGAVIGSRWLVTGDGDSDFLIAWCWRGVIINGTERGAFYAFRPR